MKYRQGVLASFFGKHLLLRQYARPHALLHELLSFRKGYNQTGRSNLQLLSWISQRHPTKHVMFCSPWTSCFVRSLANVTSLSMSPSLTKLTFPALSRSYSRLDILEQRDMNTNYINLFETRASVPPDDSVLSRLLSCFTLQNTSQSFSQTSSAHLLARNNMSLITFLSSLQLATPIFHCFKQFLMQR